MIIVEREREWEGRKEDGDISAMVFFTTINE